MSGALTNLGANALANERMRKEAAQHAARLEALMKEQNRILSGILSAVDFLARAEQQRSGQ